MHGPCSHAGEASLKASASPSPTIFCSSSFFLLYAGLPQEEVVEWLQITPFSFLSGTLALLSFVFSTYPHALCFVLASDPWVWGLHGGSGFHLLPELGVARVGGGSVLGSLRLSVLSGLGCRSGENMASGATVKSLPLSHCSYSGV